MLTLGHCGWNGQVEDPLDLRPAVGPEKDLDRDLLAGGNLAGGDPGVLDGGHTALGEQIDGGVHALEMGRLDSVPEQAVELVAPPAGQEHGHGHGHFAGRLHGGE